MVVASGLGFVVFFLMGDFELKWDQAQNDRGSDPVPAGAGGSWQLAVGAGGRDGALGWDFGGMHCPA